MRTTDSNLSLSRRLLSALAATALLALSTEAQQVSFQGKVEDVQGTTGQFFVDCTDVQLTSSLDLNLFVGQVTQITGLWNGSATNPAVLVTAIQVIPEVFEVGGGPKIGEDIGFGVTHTPGSLFWMFASTDSAFLNFGPLGVGLIDPASALLISVGTIPGGGNFQMKLPIPDNPALVGVTVYGQAAIVPPSGAPFLSNSECDTIEA